MFNQMTLLCMNLSSIRCCPLFIWFSCMDGLCTDPDQSQISRETISEVLFKCSSSSLTPLLPYSALGRATVWV